MSATKIKIWTFFLIFLFLQRIGGAMLVKVSIHEYVYKEIKTSSYSKKDGKLSSKKLICPSNRIYEECQTAFENVFYSIPERKISYLVPHFNTALVVSKIGTFLKKSSLRGPPCA